MASSVSNILSSFLSWTVLSRGLLSAIPHHSWLGSLFFKCQLKFHFLVEAFSGHSISKWSVFISVSCLIPSLLFITYDNIYLLPLFILSPLLEAPWGQKLFCSSVCTQCLAYVRASVNVEGSNPSQNLTFWKYTQFSVLFSLVLSPEDMSHWDNFFYISMEPGTVLGLYPSSGAQSINAHSVNQVVRRLVAKSSLPLDQYCMEIFGG